MRCKCRPLLAGAVNLLDSASAGFVADLRQALQQAVQALASMRREEDQIRNRMRQHGIVGESPAMTDAFRLAMRFSQLSDLPVLITGETGTGKGLLAKALSEMDPKRKGGPFLAVNCAAIQPTHLESEFFGHRRGAFTGAERDRKGLIRAAEGVRASTYEQPTDLTRQACSILHKGCACARTGGDSCQTSWP